MVTLGIDRSKTVCSLAGLDEAGGVVLRMRRNRLVAVTADLARCTVALEASCGAHHLGRAFMEQGHQVCVMPPEYVRPYVKAHKNDDRDAEAIAEAATRPTMRFAPLKTTAQLDTQTLHRVRERLVGHCAALINQMHAILLERGRVVAEGRTTLAQLLPDILAQDNSTLCAQIRRLLEDIRAEWRELDARMAVLDTEFIA